MFMAVPGMVETADAPRFSLIDAAPVSLDAAALRRLT
jgi:hypothetical protein